jgi:hypothetical protein
MDRLRYSIWQIPYQNALVERNPQKLRGRITAAEIAIALRMKQVSGNLDGQEELRDIQCALKVLKTLKFGPSMPGAR